MDFDTWMMMVDSYIQKKLGISSEDLPDQDYMGMYEDGMKPKEAAIEVLQIMKEEIEYSLEHFEGEL